MYCKSVDKPGSVVGRSSVLDPRCRGPHATYPKARRAAVSPSVRSCSGWSLHRPSSSPKKRWALTPPFHPYRAMARRFISVALVWESPPLDVIQHPALWSPDFPHGSKKASRDRLAGLQHVKGYHNRPENARNSCIRASLDIPSHLYYNKFDQPILGELLLRVQAKPEDPYHLIRIMPAQGSVIHVYHVYFHAGSSQIFILGRVFYVFFTVFLYSCR